MSGIDIARGGTKYLLSIAEPTEPTFLLMGRDPAAPAAIRKWVHLRQEKNSISDARANMALDVADAMEAWRAAHRGVKE